MSPEKLKSLADRIDHEQLWRRAGLDRPGFTAEQNDRLDAGVNLRRYADLLGANCWRIFPPEPNISYRASTLDEVVRMARRGEQAHEARQSIDAPVLLHAMAEYPVTDPNNQDAVNLQALARSLLRAWPPVTK